MTRYGMAIDVARCLGCEACLVACKMENEVPLGFYRLRMLQVTAGEFPNLASEFRLEQCFHCENPPCIPVCPTGATYKADDGLVLVDATKCTGCKACVTACPYDSRYVHPSGWTDKCDFCAHRVRSGTLPACVETCPTGARFFGDLDDRSSDVRKAIQAAGSVDVRLPETGAKPNLYYLNAKLAIPEDLRRDGTVLSGGES